MSGVGFERTVRVGVAVGDDGHVVGVRFATVIVGGAALLVAVDFASAHFVGLAVGGLVAGSFVLVGRAAVVVVLAVALGFAAVVTGEDITGKRSYDGDSNEGDG